MAARTVSRRREGASLPGKELLLDRGQAEEPLAEREGELGADLEHRKAVLDEGAKGGGGLVVRGVSLEDEVREALQRMDEIRGRVAPIREDGQRIELHSRLHDDGKDPLPRFIEPRFLEEPPMQLHGGAEVGGARGDGRLSRAVVGGLAAGTGTSVPMT